MIDEKTKKIINKHVDEYLDECRFEFIWISHERDIQELELGRFTIKDTDIIIDNEKKYDKILVHPIEDFFLPLQVTLYVTGFSVKLKLPQLEELSDFDCCGILRDEDIFIDDPRISNDQLIDLMSQTCFDARYQELETEVREYLKSVYAKEHCPRIQGCLDRIRPFLNV
jgi:hypothetical protein